MGLWRNVAFVRAPQAAACAALIAILSRRGRHEAAWGAPADLQYARAATTPWWAIAGFDGAAGWTCLLTAPYDVLTADGGALLGELSRSLGGQECWQLDVEDGDSMRVIRAAGGVIARAGYITSELDAGMDFDPGMTLPVLGDVTIADACAAARASDPAARVQVVVDGKLRPRHPADVVEDLARAHVDAGAKAIASVFGGDHGELVDNLTTIECLIRRSRPLPAAASFTLFTSGATA